jgi:hypothetical protein
MATGRTDPKWWRTYINGYNCSGWTSKIGPLSMEYASHDATAQQSDTVIGYLRGHLSVNPGTLNGLFNNTATTGALAVLGDGIAKRVITVAIGIRGEPADGDPCFNGEFLQSAYHHTGDGAVTVTVPFEGWAADSTSLLYANPWGILLHANAAATGVNAGNGFDHEPGSATTKGGLMVYQVTAGNGLATITTQHSATNIPASFANIIGATTGAIDCAVKQYGIVAVSGTINQYLRWQIALDTATSVTFTLAFCRA